MSTCIYTSARHCVNMTVEKLAKTMMWLVTFSAEGNRKLVWFPYTVIPLLPRYMTYFVSSW